jgi:hypothetical protein
MKGHIQQRGKNSWRLKFDAGHDIYRDLLGARRNVEE